MVDTPLHQARFPFCEYRNTNLNAWFPSASDRFRYDRPSDVPKVPPVHDKSHKDYDKTHNVHHVQRLENYRYTAYFAYIPHRLYHTACNNPAQFAYHERHFLAFDNSHVLLPWIRHVFDTCLKVPSNPVLR